MAETYYSLTEIIKLCDNLVAAMPTSFYNGIMAVRGGLVTTPAADVVPVKHGRWILKDDGRAHCSMCDTSGNSHVWNYCPNCGAKMKEW